MTVHYILRTIRALRRPSVAAVAERRTGGRMLQFQTHRQYYIITLYTHTYKCIVIAHIRLTDRSQIIGFFSFARVFAERL